MSATDVTLYLPVSEVMLTSALKDQERFKQTLSELAVPQLAALILLQSLSKLHRSHVASIERTFAETIAIGNAQVKNAGLPAFRADLLHALDRLKVQVGYSLLSEFRIALMDDDAVRRRTYLTAEGGWDFTFRQRNDAPSLNSLQSVELLSGREGTLTLEQSRMYREVRAQIDDHLHIQGYAGTGKSYLIQALLSMFKPTGARILILAERPRQLAALTAGASHMEQFHCKTFGQLATDIVPRDLTAQANRRMRRPSRFQPNLSDQEIARHLGIHSINGYPIEGLVDLVRSTVKRFCDSGEDEFRASHLPDWSALLNDEIKQVVFHHATELWRATLSPPAPEFQPPLFDYHRVKWAALNGWKIPAYYTHILIDECHDLSKSMLQILDASPQAVISLGDEYQNLRGRAQQRSGVVRQREVTHSIRSGSAIERIVNPIIGAHPAQTKVQFHGSRSHRTDITYYDQARIPEQPTAILVSDIWELFEWAQRLAQGNRAVELLSSREYLHMFVSDCIELHRHSTRPRHAELIEFTSWAEVSERHHANAGYQRISRMLDKKYDIKNWTSTLEKLAEPGPDCHRLGFVKDVRNREFDSVMLAPALADRAFKAKRRAELAAIGSEIYVAVTRAQRHLTAPNQLRDWIEEIART